MPRLPVSILALCLTLPAAWAQFGIPAADPSTSAEWRSEAKTIAPGSTWCVALQLHQPAGWHSYYQNSGGVEQPPAIKLTLPDGFSAGPIQWPVPEVKDGFFGKSFVYTGSPVFLIEITAPATLETGKPITLTADATWQICADNCRNEQKTFSLKLPVAAAMEKDPATADLFAKARASQPVHHDTWEISAQAEDNGILLRVDPGATVDGQVTDFVPNQPFVKAASDGGSIRRVGNAWLIRLQRATQDAFDQPIPQGQSISGILLGTPALVIPQTPITRNATASQSPQSRPFGDYLKILGGMLLGGLILNLMPCVFPVIGLKIMGFVQQAGAERKKIALHGLMFSLGVLVSFGVLSGILFAVRCAFGAGSIGWGYQLQNPWVVLCLLLLMFVLALNMFGVFEMGISATSLGGSLQSKHGLTGSLFSGVLATVVATPCSGPFLAGAMGAAVTLPACQFFLAFAAMAVGLSLPYLVLSVFPQWIAFLPRPGAWMESFKQAMSFLLFATAGYLLWVYAGLIDLEHLVGPIFGLSAIAVAAWIYGRWNLPHRTRRTRMTARVFTVLFAVGGLFLSKPPQASALNWEPWSEARVETLLEKGNPVYIDFTAQWCATCQVNKLRAYTPEVVALMHAKGVVTLKGDKTKPNPQIEQALQKLDRTAIPVNVLLAPGNAPVILPSVLSPNDLLDALRKL